MSGTTKKVNKIEIPTHIMEKHKIKSDWDKSVSSSFKKSVKKNAEKYKEALRRLSKD